MRGGKSQVCGQPARLSPCPLPRQTDGEARPALLLLEGWRKEPYPAAARGRRRRRPSSFDEDNNGASGERGSG